MMDSKTEQLINKAALAINTLDVENFAELRSLHNVMTLLSKELPAGNEKKNAKSAIDILESIMLKEITDAEAVLDKLVAEVSSVCNLINAAAEQEEQKDKSVDEQQAAFGQEDLSLVQDFVTEAGEHIENAESAMLSIETDNDPESINKVFRAFHTIKGLAGFLNLTDISRLAHSAENLLSLARDGKMALVENVADAVFETIDALKKMVDDVKTAADEMTAIPPFEGCSQLIERLDAIANGKAAPVVERRQNSERRVETRRDDDKKTKKTSSDDESIRVSIERLDNLVNMAGELVISQLMVSEDAKLNLSPEHSLCHKIAQQSKIIRNLQDLSMAMRMVPVKPLFQKLARQIRDLSRKAGKTIELITDGEDTELDRTLVDKIADPLVHMVRNSIDHGIETAEQRKAAGKNPAGKVQLKAYHKAENIVIEIADDGRGLDKDKILKKAITNGLVTANQNLSDEEIYKLIFNAGLSTAEKITDISGRGVGMDVVRKNIEAISGRIDIISQKEKGTTFQIKIPLTLATIDGQVVKIGSQKYIIPVKSIVKSFRPTEKQITTVQNKGEMVSCEGGLVRMMRLYEQFNISDAVEQPQQALLVEVEQNGRRACLLVDELLSQQQVVIKNLSQSLGSIKGVSGAAIMGDGRVSLILDIGGLLEITQ